MVILKNWSVTSPDNDGYKAPELCRHYLTGEVYGHPKHEDGKIVYTSRIIASNGRVVTTRSREYTLDGPPSPHYAEYLKSIGYELDEENPVKFR